MLDDNQIENVEKRFLNAGRPLRNKSRYYLAMMARNKKQEAESFGIFGNQCRNHGKIVNCLYGNKRYSKESKNFSQLSSRELKIIFPEYKNEKDSNLKETLLKRFIKIKDSTNDKELMRYSAFGLTRNTPVFSEKEYNELSLLAKIVEDDLISYLENNRETFVANWKNSRYYRETTFNEYFIWWYHFLYTEVTNNLAEKGFLKIPKSGNFPYIVTL